jgi:hypothetical protein
MTGASEHLSAPVVIHILYSFRLFLGRIVISSLP